MMATTSAPICSCGCSESHRIARRHTADGIRLDLWSDGLVTSGMGFGIKGVGSSRSSYEMELDVQAGWLAFSYVELCDASEVSHLVKAARRAVRQRSETPYTAMLNYFMGKRIRTLKAGRTFKWES